MNGTMSKFRIGDVVQLKSGGPLMTVDVVFNDGARCVWFDGANVKTNDFNNHVLELGSKETASKTSRSF